MSTANRVIKNTGYLYAKMGITMFISLYTTRLILNSLGATDFGIFNIVGGAIAMLGFLNGAMASATQRFMSYAEGEGRKDKQKNIFNVSIILHFLISLVVGVALLAAGYFFFNGILNIPADRVGAAKVVYGSLIVSTMFTVMTVPYDAVMNAHENMKYYALVGIVESLLKLAVAFAVVYTHSDKLVLYGILMACLPLITLSIMRVYCHKHYVECVFAPRRYWHKGTMKEMTSFAGWNFLGSFVIMVSANGQGIVLNHFFGVLLNTAQGIASQISGQLQGLSVNMLKALNPVLAKSAGADDRNLLIKTTLLGNKYATALFLILAIPVFIETPFILRLWLKEVPEWTIIFVRFQLLRSFIEFQFLVLPNAIAATGKIKGYTIWSFISNILQLPVMYLFFYLQFPPYFIYISAIIFGNILVYIGALHYVKIYCNINIKDCLYVTLNPIYFSLVPTMIILYLIKLIFQINTLFFLSGFFLLSILLFVTMFYFFGCTENERKQICILVKQLSSKIKS